MTRTRQEDEDAHVSDSLVVHPATQAVVAGENNDDAEEDDMQHAPEPAHSENEQRPRPRATDDNDERESESESQASPGSSQLWPVSAILQERIRRGKTEYLLAWESIDPATGLVYTPSWEPKESATPALIQEWKEKKRTASAASMAAGPTAKGKGKGKGRISGQKDGEERKKRARTSESTESTPAPVPAPAPIPTRAASTRDTVTSRLKKRRIIPSSPSSNTEQNPRRLSEPTPIPSSSIVVSPQKRPIIEIAAPRRRCSVDGKVVGREDVEMGVQREKEEAEDEDEGEKDMSLEGTMGVLVIPDSQSQSQGEKGTQDLEEPGDADEEQAAVEDQLLSNSTSKTRPSVRFVELHSSSSTAAEDDIAHLPSSNSHPSSPPQTKAPSRKPCRSSSAFQSSFPASRPLGTVPIPTRAAFLATNDSAAPISSQTDVIEDPDSSPHRADQLIPSTSRLLSPAASSPVRSTSASRPVASHAPLSRHSSRASTTATSDFPSSHNRKRKPQLVLVLQDDPSSTPIDTSSQDSTSSSPAGGSGMSNFEMSLTASQLIPVILKSRIPEEMMATTGGPFSIRRNSNGNGNGNGNFGRGRQIWPAMVKPPIARPAGALAVGGGDEGEGDGVVASRGYQVEEATAGGGGDFDDEEIMFDDFVDFSALDTLESGAVPLSRSRGHQVEAKDSGEGTNGETGGEGRAAPGAGGESNSDRTAGATHSTVEGGATGAEPASAGGNGGAGGAALQPFLTAWTPQLPRSDNWFSTSNDVPNGGPATEGAGNVGASTSGATMDSIAAFLMKKIMNPPPPGVVTPSEDPTTTTATTPPNNGKRILEAESSEDPSTKKARTAEPTPEPDSAVPSRNLANAVNPRSNRSPSPSTSSQLAPPALGLVKATVGLSSTPAGSTSSRNASPAPGGGSNLTELIRASPFIVDTDGTKDEIVRFVASPAIYINGAEKKPLCQLGLWAFELRRVAVGDKTDIIILNTTDGTYLLKRIPLSMAPSFDIARSLSHVASRRPSVVAAPAVAGPSTAGIPAPPAVPNVSEMSRPQLESELLLLRTRLPELEFELAKLAPLSSEVPKLRSDVADLTVKNRRLQTTKETLQSDLQYMQTQYSEASGAAVSRAKEAEAAEKEANQLRGLLDTGLRQKDLFQRGQEKCLKEQVQRLSVEVKLLKEERRRSQDVAVRTKASLWDSYLEREKLRRERKGTFEISSESEIFKERFTLAKLYDFVKELEESQSFMDEEMEEDEEDEDDEEEKEGEEGPNAPALDDPSKDPPVPQSLDPKLSPIDSLLEDPLSSSILEPKVPSLPVDYNTQSSIGLASLPSSSFDVAAADVGGISQLGPLTQAPPRNPFLP